MLDIFGNALGLNKKSSSLQNLSSSSKQEAIVADENFIVVPTQENNLSTNTNLKSQASHMDWVTKFWKHFLAGGVAGGISRTATAPIDRIKVLMQVQNVGEAKLVNIKGCINYMVHEGSWRSFWKGNGVNVLKYAPENALKLSIYDQLKLHMTEQMDIELGFLDRIIAGSTAGTLAQTVAYPMDVLKIRFCLRKTGQYRGILDAIVKIYHAEGIGAFYKGFKANIIGVIPYAGIDLAIYEKLKNWYIETYPENPSKKVCAVWGVISSITGVTIVYPLYLIRSRQQAHTSKMTLSITQVFKQIMAQEGFRGLYRGLTLNYLKTPIAVGINYYVYEVVQEFLGTKMS